MTTQQARDLIKDALDLLNTANTALNKVYVIWQKLKAENAAEVLGYDGFDALFKEEFQDAVNVSTSHLSRIRHYIETVDLIAEHSDSPVGENDTPTPPPSERSVRPLSAVKSPEAKRQIWQDATAAAGGQNPTGKQTEAARDRWLVREHEIQWVATWMDDKRMTPRQAIKLLKVLEGCHATTRADIERWQITDTALVNELDRIRTSQTYAEIKASGVLYVGDDQTPVKLQDLTTQDLRQELRRRSAIYRQGALSHAAPQSLIVYPADTAATYRALSAVLSAEQLSQLANYIYTQGNQLWQQQSQSPTAKVAQAKPHTQRTSPPVSRFGVIASG